MINWWILQTLDVIGNNGFKYEGSEYIELVDTYGTEETHNMIRAYKSLVEATNVKEKNND